MLLEIADALFPGQNNTGWVMLEVDKDSIPLFTTTELTNAASKIKGRKAPRPDRIATFTTTELTNAASKIKGRKAPRPDRIATEVVKLPSVY
ncbi:hypothetical protein QE152_g33385 [Popillia japonica]|uniref:Uncharacterized protein n=1 Tax=Popillia japonica TaxID=7064 RepID=A0AAW1IX65_POPJA